MDDIRENRRVLRMPAVLKRGEQVGDALERATVTRPERPLELRIAQHAPGCPLLVQENRFVDVTENTTVAPHRNQPRNHGRGDFVQVVRRDIIHSPTEEAALRCPQHKSENVIVDLQVQRAKVTSCQINYQKSFIVDIISCSESSRERWRQCLHSDRVKLRQ